MMDVDPASLAARLVHHQRQRRTVFDWMHPQRLAGVPYAEHARESGAADTAALAEAFLDTIGMRAAPLVTFIAPGTELALLPPKECLTVFRLRALLDRVEEVRAWIDRPRRGLLIEWIGPQGGRLLLGPRRVLGAHAATPVARRRPLAATDGDALAWLGFRLFEHECAWAPDGPLAVVQLAMPADAAHDAQQVFPAGHGGNPSRVIVAQLPNLFPEGPW